MALAVPKPRASKPSKPPAKKAAAKHGEKTTQPKPKRVLTPEQRAKCAPKKPSEVKSTKYDWVEVERMYVQGNPDPAQGPRWPSLANIAQRVGASITTVEGRSRAGGWPEKRLAYQRQLRELEDQQHLEHLASFSVKSRVAFLGTGLRIQQKADEKLRDETVDTTDLRRISGALKDAQQVVEVALGRPAVGPTVIVDWAIFAKPDPKVVETLPLAPREDP
jgi:hypothetical protein